MFINLLHSGIFLKNNNNNSLKKEQKKTTLKNILNSKYTLLDHSISVHCQFLQKVFTLI